MSDVERLTFRELRRIVTRTRSDYYQQSVGSERDIVCYRIQIETLKRRLKSAEQEKAEAVAQRDERDERIAVLITRAREAEASLADSLKAIVRQSHTIERLDADLTAWREWVQFVFRNGGPVSGSDLELRAAVCASADAAAERDEAVALLKGLGGAIRVLQPKSSLLVTVEAWLAARHPAQET